MTLANGTILRKLVILNKVKLTYSLLDHVILHNSYFLKDILYCQHFLHTEK